MQYAAEEKEKVGTVIGIDLGTTYSCVGIMRNGLVEIIANDRGNRIIPSYVAFTSEKHFIGDAAKNQGAMNPVNTIFDVKRLIGRKFADSTVQRDRKLLPYKIFDSNGKAPSKGIIPDEAVDYGAAVQAGILSGDGGEATDGIVLVDVAPLSHGIETFGGVMSKIIPRNSKVPASKSQTFTTYQNNQEVVSIQVFEGERAMTNDCHMLGKLDLTGIRKAPRSKPQIVVSFDVNTDCIPSVSAEEEGASNKKCITTTIDKGRLSEEEIEPMVRDAEEMKDEDEKVKKKVEAKNNLEQLILSVKTAIEDKDKIKDKVEVR